MNKETPATGIMQTSENFYRVACTCGSPEDDITLNIEIDEVVTVNVWTRVKTCWWKSRFSRSEIFIFDYLLNVCNDWLNRVEIIWCALTKGYVEMESFTILNEQTVKNLGELLISVSDKANDKKMLS